MKLTLDVKIPLEILEGGKTKEKLEVFYRDFTREEKKEREELVAKFTKLFKQANKLQKKEESLNRKIKLNEKIGDFKKALKLEEEKDKLHEEMEALSEQIEELGGDDFKEELAKKRFDLLVSGKDKEKLREYCEIKGYMTILSLMDAKRAEIEKKHLGE